MGGRLRETGLAAARELAERERSDGAVGGARSRAGRRGSASSVEAVGRLELRVCRPARAHEVRVVGVRKAVGVGAGRREHGLLFEREDEVDGAGRDEGVGDRLGSLGVGSRVRAPLLHVELAATSRRELGEEAARRRLPPCGSRDAGALGPLSDPEPSSAPRR